MTKKTWALSRYFILFFIAFLCDRITKFWAVYYLDATVLRLCSYLNFHLMWNRGVAGSFLSPTSMLGFALLTFFIMCMIGGFLFFSFIRYHNNHSIYLETLVLSGALSNVVDRFVYGAVVDFIECHYHSWYFPTFNIADALIFIGVVGILVLSHYADAHARR